MMQSERDISGNGVVHAHERIDPATLDPQRASDRFLDLITRDFARLHLILSQGRIDDVEHLIVSTRSDQSAIHNVGTRLTTPLTISVCEDDEALAAAIDEAYTDQDTPDDTTTDSEHSFQDDEMIDQLLAQTDRDLLSTEGKGPIVQLVDALLLQALRRHASDVHIQPLENETLVRYRLDGVLQTVRTLPAALATPMISRIKVMGRMDIAERRVPQDGRATVTIGHQSVSSPDAKASIPQPASDVHTIDLRISTIPTSYGERTVIRLLDNTTHLCDFSLLGMPDSVAQQYLACATQAHGIILLTGPTGSGKTTTLYATLRKVGSPDLNIMTVEDPIEYQLASVGLAISQTQVNPRKGVTFASGLRHILRQDPDVVMVGEIRDEETARIAVQASLTGHLVFSTLHTNDAASAPTRLIDLGIEPYLVSAGLSSVLAQRLVRRLHSDCGGHGCDACFGSGYRGRCGIFELLGISDEVAELINQADAGGPATRHIRETAIAQGMRTLQQEGARLVREGITSQQEILRVAGVREGDTA
jgi:general secretion pathway protein E